MSAERSPGAPEVEVLEVLTRIRTARDREVEVRAIRPYVHGPVLVEIATQRDGGPRYSVRLPARDVPAVLAALQAFTERGS